MDGSDGPPEGVSVRETTAEIWIGPDQSTDWIGTQGGINSSHLMLLRENSRPSWLLLPGNLYDARPPQIQPVSAWIAPPDRLIQVGLLMFAVLGARVPEVAEALMGQSKWEQQSNLDLDRLFPTGIPDSTHEICRESLRGWHVIVSVGSGSSAYVDKDSLGAYRYLTTEVRETTWINRAIKAK